VTALFLVLIASLLVAVLFLGAFIWSVRRDQFEDQRGNAMRMLYDDELVVTDKK
jgi:cbb3-type cytochrome oxidase maturation protein